MARKNDAEMQEGADLEGSDVSRVYELGFHLDPELPSEEVKKAYQELRSMVEAQGAIVAEGEPEKVRLAYTISRQETSGRRDFDSAYFAWIAYETSAAKHEEVLSAAKGDSRIIRFIDVITSKDAARHAVEMRELSRSTPEAKNEAEEANDATLDAALESAAA
ncbi:MAG TPA: 30S ribosomal protein S6 [Candidatus Paceibacterota bacterium]|nr:30S ribosomal protein S6 [Candidatus Paceibacterota bacterium]